MGRIILLLFLLVPTIIIADETKNQTRESRDTYLDAYKESHSGGSSSGFAEPPSSQKIQQPSPSYAPVYAKPVSSYLPAAKPAPTYLPSKPSNSYLPQKQTELTEPIPSYLKPSTGHIETTDGYGYNNMKYPIMDKPMYGVPHFHHHYQIPEPVEPETDVDKGHGGFDLKTVFKFILKLIVIKKIVKLVYIVMYFLFMPKFSILEMLASFLKDKDSEKDKPDDSDEKPDEEDEDNNELDDEDDDSFFRSGRFFNDLNDLTTKVAQALSNPPQ